MASHASRQADSPATISSSVRRPTAALPANTVSSALLPAWAHSKSRYQSQQVSMAPPAVSRPPPRLADLEDALRPARLRLAEPAERALPIRARPRGKEGHALRRAGAEADDLAS